jgi:hypothetical protein
MVFPRLYLFELQLCPIDDEQFIKLKTNSLHHVWINNHTSSDVFMSARAQKNTLYFYKSRELQ